jgi:hypothetical protein
MRRALSLVQYRQNNLNALTSKGKFHVLKEHITGWKKVIIDEQFHDESLGIVTSTTFNSHDCSMLNNFQKVILGNRGKQFAVVELIIPRGTQIYSDGWKYRASKAFVVDIRDVYGRQQKEAKSIVSFLYPNDTSRDITYKLGKIVKCVGQFSMNPSVCASGIHFFEQNQIAWHF